MVYCGIDGGLSGGIAFLDDTPGSQPWGLSSMPLQSVGKRQELDVIRLWEIMISNWSTHTAITLIIEECSYHQPSHAAMRSQALSYGKLVALLELKNIRFIPVQAQRWQSKLFGKLPKGTTKAAALGMAKRLWPKESFVLEGCRTPHSGIIDACLLAEYGRRERL